MNKIVLRDREILAKCTRCGNNIAVKRGKWVWCSALYAYSVSPTGCMEAKGRCSKCNTPFELPLTEAA